MVGKKVLYEHIDVNDYPEYRSDRIGIIMDGYLNSQGKRVYLVLTNMTAHGHTTNIKTWEEIEPYQIKKIEGIDANF